VHLSYALCANAEGCPLSIPNRGWHLRGVPANEQALASVQIFRGDTSFPSEQRANAYAELLSSESAQKTAYEFVVMVCSFCICHCFLLLIFSSFFSFFCVAMHGAERRVGKIVTQ